MFTGRFVALISLSLVMGVFATLGIFLVSVLLYGVFHSPQEDVSLIQLNLYVIGVWFLWLLVFIRPRALPRSIGVWVNITFLFLFGIAFQNHFPGISEGGLFISTVLLSYNALVRWEILTENT